MSNYWNINDKNNKTEGIFGFLNELGKELNDKTKGQLDAKLHKVKYTSSLIDTSKALTKFLNQEIATFSK